MMNVHNLIKLDKYTNIIPTPRLQLMTRTFVPIGNITHYTDWRASVRGNDLDEISFTVTKYVNGVLNPIWDDLIDLKVVSVEHGGKFEIQVSYTDESQTIKSVSGVSLETELGQVYLNDFHVNDEFAIEDENYKVTVFYNPEDTDHSLLHRALKDKAPHWKINESKMTPYVIPNEREAPESVSEYQREYTVDGSSIYDFFTGDVAKDANVVFRFDTDVRELWCESLVESTDPNKQPKVAGEDTTILVSKKKLGNEISIESNKDEVKNCFKIEGGDDLMTSQVAVVNMTGTPYIYQFADFQLEDMSEDLRNAIISYGDWLTGREDQYYGDQGIYTQYVEADERLYELRDSMAPSISIDPPEDAHTQWDILKAKIEDPDMKIGVFLTNSYDSEFFRGITNNVSAMLEVWADSRYKIKILDDPSPTYDGENLIWKGVVQVSKVSDENDYYPLNTDIEHNPNAYIFTAKITQDSETDLTYTKQKVQIALAKGDMSRVDEEFLPSTPYYGEDDPSVDWNVDGKDNRNSHVNDYWYKPSTNVLYKYTKSGSNYSWSTVPSSEAQSIIEDLEDLREYLNAWNYQKLYSFHVGFETCQSVLMSGTALKNGTTVEREIAESLYNEYTRRLKLVDQVYELRSEQVETQSDLVEKLYSDVRSFQEESSFNSYLKNQLHYSDEKVIVLYKEYRSYIREDTYQNSNYISTDLESPQELIDNAKKLLAAAQKELNKACILQRTVSVSLNNLLAIPEFEPLYSKFEMFNYIRIRTDDEILKLRLVGVDYSGDSMESIDVTFSDQIESIDGSVSDLQSVIAQAKSIATSYSSTVEKASQGSEARNYVLETIQNGLNAANTMLKNSDDNEVTISRSGIIAKRMDDQGIYGDKQLRIIGNGIYMTTDAWDSISMAVGEIQFTDPRTQETSWKYGVIADAIVGNIIVGQNLIIGNEKNTVTIDGNGITITGGTITWDTTGTGTTGVKIPALVNSLSEISAAYQNYVTSKVGTLDHAVADYLGLSGSGTIVGPTYLVSPYIGGGYLNITNGNKQVIIDPKNLGNTGYIFAVKNGTEYTVGIDSNGNSTFKGTVYASAGKFTGEIEASSGDIGGWSIDSTSIYKGNFKLSSVNTTLESYNDNYGTIIGSGFLQFFNGTYSSDVNLAIGYITTGTWQNSSTVGLNFNVPKNGKYISFGHRTTDSGTWTTPLVINHGLNPNGYTQGVIIYGDARTMGSLYVNSNDYINGSSSTYNGLYISSALKTDRVFAGNYVHGDYALDVNGTSYFSSYMYIGSTSYYLSGWTTSGTIVGIGTNGKFYANGGFVGNVTGSATSAGTANYATSAGTATSATSASEADYAGHLGDSSTYVVLNSDDRLVPHENNAYDLGSSARKWKNIYYAGSFNPSDRNLKENIQSINEAYESLFLSFQPVSYKFKDGKRTHLGFISQDVEVEIKQANMTNLDFAGFCKEVKKEIVVDPNDKKEKEIPVYDNEGKLSYSYGLNYTEFIALNTHMIQKLYKRVEELETELSALKQG